MVADARVAAMVLLNNDFSSIVVAIEMGRLVFDNLKKVMIYLMPVRHRLQSPLRTADLCIGWFLHRVCCCIHQCLPGHATSPEFVPSSLLLHTERRRHVHIVDVREARSWCVRPDYFMGVTLILCVSRSHAAQAAQRTH